MAGVIRYHSVLVELNQFPTISPSSPGKSPIGNRSVREPHSQQILFINRKLPSSARYFRPFQAKQKDLRYTNYLRSSLSLRYFSGEFLCRVVGGSTKSVLPTRKTVQFRREKCPIAPRGQSRSLIRLAGGRLAISQANRTHSGQLSDGGCWFASPHSKSNFLTLSSVMSHSVPSRAILSLPEDGIKGTPYSLQSS